jgi:hypothetical protein
MMLLLVIVNHAHSTVGSLRELQLLLLQNNQQQTAQMPKR